MATIRIVSRSDASYEWGEREVADGVGPFALHVDHYMSRPHGPCAAKSSYWKALALSSARIALTGEFDSPNDLLAAIAAASAHMLRYWQLKRKEFNHALNIGPSVTYPAATIAPSLSRPEAKRPRPSPRRDRRHRDRK